MTKIENMIDLRLRCVELALEFYKDNRCCSTGDIKNCAEIFESYILDDSELPKSPMNLNEALNKYILNVVKENKKQVDDFDKIRERLSEF